MEQRRVLRVHRNSRLFGLRDSTYCRRRSRKAVKDTDWIRSIAAKPAHLRQPIYESLRLQAIAARLELLERQNRAFKAALHAVATFMQAQEDGDLHTAHAALLQYQAAFKEALASEEPDEIETEAAFDLTPGSSPTALRRRTEVRHTPQATLPSPEPPNVVESDPSVVQED